MTRTRDELLGEIRSAAAKAKGPYLTYDQFRELSGIPMSQVYRHFDSWTDACHSARVPCGRASPGNITPRYSKGKEHALREVEKVAGRLGVSSLSKAQFDSQKPEVKSQTVAVLWGGWHNAIRAAGLEIHPSYQPEISLRELAHEFLAAVSSLGGIPTVNQLARRSQHSKNSFTRKFGTYRDFKRAAIEFLLQHADLKPDDRLLIEDHLASLRSPAPSPPAPPHPHRKGRHLGFRAFAFAPTYEQEVVSLFSTVADELGFEIVCQRQAFPDCEARRRTNSRRPAYRKCLIEFEFRSSDYVRHGHPVDGCDLLVCWEHDWSDCPLEVLELRSEINRLRGWK
ncbi:MAG TPA: hypothetical protein VMY37_13925 [Thermoguttaceae bacterium]|nr:hypothetical protein [Thermoguttaceae bacterium]